MFDYYQKVPNYKLYCEVDRRQTYIESAHFIVIREVTTRQGGSRNQCLCNRYVLQGRDRDNIASSNII